MSQALTGMLLEACKNPKSPGFNHYLFEAVAALVKHGVAANPGSLGAIEAQLFGPFELVLQQDVQEFHPYVFQVRMHTHCAPAACRRCLHTNLAAGVQARMQRNFPVLRPCRCCIQIEN